MLKGIDVSEHNGNINWDAVKASGIDFAIIRSSYGHFVEDAKFRRNVSECGRVGMKYGLYHYSYVANDDQKIAEANGFINLCKQVKPLYPCYIDMEDADGWKAKNGVSNAMNVEVCRYTCEQLEKAGYYAGIYANLDWLNNRINSSSLDNYDKWLAQWSSKPTYNKSFGVWQYTSKGSVSGISGNVDMNTSYRDYPTIILSGGLNQSGGSNGGSGNGGDRPSTDITIGSVVTVNNGAKSYEGASIAPFVYTKQYNVIQLTNDRAVLGDGLNTAFRVSDLKLAGSGNTGSSSTIKVGDTVRPTKAVSYEGIKLMNSVTEKTYPVTEVKENRVVLGNGLNTAFNSADLIIVTGGTSQTIQVGDKVSPIKPISYEGVKLANFVTNRIYPVIELNGNRAVLGNGLNTAFNTNNLQKR